MRRRNFLASAMAVPFFGMLKNNEPVRPCPPEIYEYLYSDIKTKPIYLMCQAGHNECWNIFYCESYNEFDNCIRYYIDYFKNVNINKEHILHIENKSDSIHIYICTESHYLENQKRYAQ